MTTTIIGVDPGLVHTGVVVMRFEDDNTLAVSSEAFAGGDVVAPVELVRSYGRGAFVFIESYRRRGNAYSTDPEMEDLLANFRRELPGASVIDNTGVKNVITRELMSAIGVWKFQTRTHHQDLRSAARIALYGAVKDEVLNGVIYRYAMSKLMPAGLP